MNQALSRFIITAFLFAAQLSPAGGRDGEKGLGDLMSVTIGGTVDQGAGRVMGTLEILLPDGATLTAPSSDGAEGALTVTLASDPLAATFQPVFPNSTEKTVGNLKTRVYTGQVVIPWTATWDGNKVPDLITMRLGGTLCHHLCIPVDAAYDLHRMGTVFVDRSGVVQGDRLFNPSYLLMLLFAFLGGVILNVMPCVLPVLSLKLKTLTRTQDSAPHYSLRTGLWVSAAGIWTTFFIFAMMTASIDHIGEVSGWGLHFQNPVFLNMLCLVTALFALNLWGVVTFSLPSTIQTKMARALGRAHDGMAFYIEDYLSGIFATFLATPCTGPLLGTALGYAFTLSSPHVFLFFMVMGLGFSLPYWLGAMLPDRFLRLPRPGPWMDILSKVLGLFIGCGALLLLWLLWVGHGIGWGLLTACFLGILTILVMLWRRGIIGSFLVAAWIFIAVTAPIADFIPMIQSSVSDSTDDQDPIEDAPPNGAEWHVFTPSRLEAYQRRGDVVFLDVTADWCVTCHLNKRAVLETDRMKQTFRASHVRLLRADFTRKDRTIAQLLKRYRRQGIPFNIVFGPGAPDGIVLPEVLNPTLVQNALTAAQGKTTTK